MKVTTQLLLVFCLIGINDSSFAQPNPQYKIERRRARTLYDNQFRFAKNYTLSIDSELLGQCFYLEGSKRSKVTLPTVKSRYPELFAYLSGAKYVPYQSGTEQKLRTLILNSPDNSIDPVTLFRWSLALNHGNLFKAALGVHELLRNEARFYNFWIRYSSTKELRYTFFNKLIDIRGDLEERGNHYSGDHRGSWYRMWGTMVHYLKMAAPGEDQVGALSVVSHSAYLPYLATFRGHVIAKLAEWQKPLTMEGRDDDPRKAELNAKGYETMHSMILFAQTAELTDAETAELSQKCETRAYLIDIEHQP